MENYLDSLPRGGFSFENYKRNEMLASKGNAADLKYTKTGTTIIGLVCKDAVVIAADTRASAGSVVAVKNTEKIHYIAPNIYCCGAGTAADNDAVTHMLSVQLKLHRLQSGRESRVGTAAHKAQNYLFRYGGHVGAYLIFGGVDFNGPHLCQVSADGCRMHMPFVSMGSGSLAAISILETEYKDNLSIEEGKAIAAKAIQAGIYQDLGSGSNVDLCVITKGDVDYLRNYIPLNKDQYDRPKKRYELPASSVIHEMKVPLSKIVDIQEVKEEKMDTS
mmetsp:Transcript_23860/g.27048  ORF Transcript_23860/g.27048 Transcript_23860/m.27048 type:complete len:276 (+) Transcript_23860:56-883(+)